VKAFVDGVEGDRLFTEAVDDINNLIYHVHNFSLSSEEGIRKGGVRKPVAALFS